MSQEDEAVAASVTAAENLAKSSMTNPKLRSCTVCRSRKVKCDKQTPCSNCRAAGIACVLPSGDRPPRWARRLDRLAEYGSASHPRANRNITQSVGKVMDRLQMLEGLVKELRGELQRANTAASSPADTPSLEPTTSPALNLQPESLPSLQGSGVRKHFGRMVTQNTRGSRYISGGFWTRIIDELDQLKIDTHELQADDWDSSDDEMSSLHSSAPSKHDYSSTDHHSFLFRRPPDVSPANLHIFHPLPSQIPFLLDVFSENVDSMMRIVHMPTVTKMVRDWRSSGMKTLSPSSEALLFSIYFCAIVSMEDHDVANNFGCSKAELILKYRLGLEHALSKADFLVSPNLTLVQAFTLFLLLVRRHDSPKFVWMMTGLLIRMAQYLGLQRDGAKFHGLTPYEIEMRRRVWWIICLLDVRASEDQGTEITIPQGSFDTKIPLNINDADYGPNSEGPLVERATLTDSSFTIVIAEIAAVSRSLAARGDNNGAKEVNEQQLLINQLWQKFEQYGNQTDGIAYWVGVTACKLVMGKLTLVSSRPVLFATPNEHASAELRNKLFVSAIEVAEYNHALNAEEAARRWRWIYQTHTHWYAIVYLMLEITRRPLSPTVERAWLALHSPWLFPKHPPNGKVGLIFVPLQQLLDEARKHRESELYRLRAKPSEVARLLEEDRKIPCPASPGPFQTGFGAERFHQYWYQLVTMPDTAGGQALASNTNSQDLRTHGPGHQMLCVQSESQVANITVPDATSCVVNGRSAATGTHTNAGRNYMPTSLAYPINCPVPDEVIGQPQSLPPPEHARWNQLPSAEATTLPWLHSSANVGSPFQVSSNMSEHITDSHMDFVNDVNWYNWIESAQSAEVNAWSDNFTQR